MSPSSYTAGKPTALWLDPPPATAYAAAPPELAVDVAILGGGITGLTTALLLAQAGKRVAVLEAGRIVTRTSGFTTAKLTANHGLIYAELHQSVGAARARIYAEANQAAVRHEKVEDR